MEQSAITSENPRKRKVSVLDVIGEPKPIQGDGDVIDVNAERSKVAEAIDGGDMVRITKGIVRVHKNIYTDKCPVSAEVDAGIRALTLSHSETIDIVFTIPRQLLAKSDMICCILENSTMSVTAFD